MNIQYTTDEFFEKFRPVPNLSRTASGPNLYIAGDVELQYGFETYGTDLDYVQSIPKGNVWTVVEEEGILYVINGYHVVNRLVHMITEKSWEDEGEHIVAEY